jgi:hypothetical protein
MGTFVAKYTAKGLVPGQKSFCEPHFSIYRVRSSDGAFRRGFRKENKLMTRELIALTRCFAHWHRAWNA